MDKLSLKPRFFAGPVPGPTKALDRLPISMEYRRNDTADLPLDELGRPSLPLEEVSQGRERVEREDAALFVLGRSRVEPNRPGTKVDLRPFQGQDLANAPTGEIQESHERFDFFRESLDDCLDLGLFEEALPNVADLDGRN